MKRRDFLGLLLGGGVGLGFLGAEAFERSYTIPLLRSKINTLYSDLNASNRRYDSLNQEYRGLEQTLSEREERMSELSREYKGLEQTLSEREKRISKLELELPVLRKRMSELDQEYQSSQERVSELNQDYQGLEQTLSEREERMSELDQELEETLTYRRMFPNIAKKDGVLVGAYYYPWYRPIFPGSYKTWDRLCKEGPILGAYSSRHQLVIDPHIDWATGHGINLFIVSWSGPTSWENETFMHNLLRSPCVNDVKVCVLYESLSRLKAERSGGYLRIPIDHPYNRQTIFNDFDYLKRNYFGKLSYLKIDEKPVIFMYLSRAYSDVEDTLNELRDRLNGKIYLIGDEVYWHSPGPTLNLTQYDAITSYNMHSSHFTPEFMEHFWEGSLEKQLEWKDYCDEAGIGFMLNVMPSFDDTKIRPEERHPIIPRNEENFRRFCEEVKKELRQRSGTHSSTGVIFTSFNEWFENTQLEPSHEKRFNFLKIVKDRII